MYVLNYNSDPMHCHGVTRFRQMWVDKVPQTPLHHHWLPQIQIQCSANTNTVQHICKYKYVIILVSTNIVWQVQCPFMGEILLSGEKKAMVLETICQKKGKKFKQLFAGAAKITVITKQTRNTHEPHKICNERAKYSYVESKL